jgi:cytochrome P450
MQESNVTELVERDYYTDHSICRNPYEFFEALRAHGPVYKPTNRDYFIVTGFQEVLEVLGNTRDFSATISLQGAAVPLPFKPEGSDITEQVRAHQYDFYGGELVVNYDDTLHKNSRALLNRLFVPSRLKSNAEFMAGFADDLISQVVVDGGCELMSKVATPFVTLVVADLLGVPPEDRNNFMVALSEGPPPGSLDTEEMLQAPPLEMMNRHFIKYIEDRRANPRNDILSELANATFPDGTIPDPMEVTRLSTFLFAAGQDTSAKLLGNSMRYIVDVPGLQDDLRSHPEKIPSLLEEVLRLEGSTKATARLARKDTVVGGVKIPAGSKLLLALAAANRDSKRWENPASFQMDRPGNREHLSFGRGAHTCAGAPLARAEVRILLEKLLAATSQIDIVEAKHGPRGNRSYDFEPSFITRGLAELYISCSPARTPAKKSA